MAIVPEGIIREVSIEEITKHIEWLTKETPARISGTGQDRKAAEYVRSRLSEYGLEAGIYEFETYNSRPGRGSLTVLTPHEVEVPCEACCHIASTPEGGITAELVYVGPGGEDDYLGKDVKGKFVLAEVSYAPATPEKAMIAWKRGALGLVLSNWGTPAEDVICMRALKAVWGNPTPETYEQIPQVTGVTISRLWGEKLKEMCRAGKVVIRMAASAPRLWETLAQPYGVLRGATEPKQFVLVTGHLDAWEPGVTCNATGNASMLELARVLARHREELRRSIYFVFWNGHEIAEAAGSTWFVDTFWPDISENCVAYINIDSTGLKDTSGLKVSVSRELARFVTEVSQKTLNEPVRVSYLSRTGDQSFFGVGVPAIAGRYAYSDEYVERTHGATLGWWNHTTADTLDKYDPKVMEKDMRVQVAYVWNLATEPVLPYDFCLLVKDIKEKLALLSRESKNVVDLSPVLSEAEVLDALVRQLNVARARGTPDEGRTRVINRVSMKLSRILTNAFYTSATRFEQDSYGLSILAKPIPALYPIVSLAQMDPASLEYKLLKTKVIRARNRVWDALNSAVYVLKDGLLLLGEGV